MVTGTGADAANALRAAFNGTALPSCAGYRANAGARTAFTASRVATVAAAS